ncbi:MAG: hypothetical protein JWO86_4189 [Myxococcaceae bacterium]|nr:hypothetical protein [Myxococcaceae bacterium]
MRLRPALALLPALLLPAACASTPTEQSGSSRAAIQGSCSSSREAILASTSAARSQAITRGFAWLDANVPYSQSQSYEGYRTDCSGFVSMCWELGTSTNTATLFATGTYDSDLGSWDDLLPADAIVRQGHVVLFLGWEPDKSGVCVLEQASTASDMQFRVRSLASLQSGGFKPIRATNLADDTAATTTTTGSDPAAPADPTVPADPTTTTPAPADPSTCVSPAEVDVCNAAKLTRGITCGIVVDACGKTVDCSLVAGFNCGTTCQPGAPADLCGHEKAARGVQCGVISNGCGGTTSCDAVPGFGCTNGDKCNASHRCEKPGSTAPAPAMPEAPAASGSVPPIGDTGDDGTTAAAADTTGSTDPSTSTGATSLPKAAASPTASSGCSASPAKLAGGGTGDALPLLGLAFALGVARRRSRRRD